MSDYVRSDDHIDHDGIIQVCGRPYQNVDQMRRDYVKKHNALVTKHDTTYFLGDLMMHKHPGVLYDYIHAMHGRKILVLGNHDQLAWYKYTECGFEQVHSYLAYKDGIHMIHDPSASCIARQDLWLCGHLHSSVKFRYCENHFDCGVDGNQGNPYLIEDILELVK